MCKALALQLSPWLTWPSGLLSLVCLKSQASDCHSRFRAKGVKGLCLGFRWVCPETQLIECRVTTRMQSVSESE